MTCLQKKIQKNGRKGAISVSTVALLAVLCAPGAAQAGFEWKPPARPVTPAVDAGALMPEMPAVPRDKVETIDLQAPAQMPSAAQTVSVPPVVDYPARVKPVLSEHPVTRSVSAPNTVVPATPDLTRGLSAQNLSAQDRIDVQPVAAKQVPAPVLTQVQSSDAEQALGFGSDIPLALAMRQIVPAHYAYVFDSSVDQGARVTWNGGKAWDLVLADAVAPLGLGVALAGGTVHVAPKEKLPQDTAQIPAAISAPEHEAQERALREQTKEQAREVYVRRNSSGDPVAQDRAPGQAATAPADGVIVREKKKSSFWSHFGLDSTEKTTLRNNNTAPLPATSGATAHRVVEQRAPQGAPQGQIVAEYHEPILLTQPPGPAADAAKAGGALDPYAVSFWQAEKGDSLRNVLQSWSDDAGVRLYWVPAADYTLPQAVRLQGSYTDAVTMILGAYADSPARPVGRLHPNLPAGPSVLIVEPAV